MVKEGLGTRLREARTAKGFSQQYVADSLHISRQSISQWESGRSYPDVDNLVLLSYLYEVNLDLLLKGEQPTELVAELISKDNDTKHSTHEENTNASEYNDSKPKGPEILGLSTILILSCHLPFVGILVPLIIFSWMIRNKIKYRILYFLCVCTFIIGVYNAYVICEHLFFDWGTSTIEEISSLL